MKNLLLAIVLVSNFAYAKTTYVKGYTKSNGTYVQPYIRSSPDKVKWNNFGPSKSAGSNYGGGYTSPNLRDSDADGIPNYQDHDDNNNGIQDDNE